MKALDLITSSLRLVGVIDPNQTVPAAIAQASLMVLNQMVESWGAERLMVFTVARSEYSLTAGQQTYTLGQGGPNSLSQTRPVRIDRVSVISFNNAAQPLELPIAYLNDQEWQAVPVKNIPSTLPNAVWDDQNFPYRTLWYYPVPTTQVDTVIYAWSALSQFASLTDDHSFPPGYLRALRYNLAVELAAEFGGAATLSPVTVSIATQSKALIKSINIPTLFMYCDDALVSPRGGVFNWLTGETQRSGSGNY